MTHKKTARGNPLAVLFYLNLAQVVYFSCVLMILCTLKVLKNLINKGFFKHLIPRQPGIYKILDTRFIIVY